jgi:hypothetical protein
MRRMRVALWVIVALLSVGLVVQAIGLHGSKDERSNITHAVRAPFRDFRKRDAHALCADFTPGVDVQLAGGNGGDCDSNAARMFKANSREADGTYSPILPTRLKVTDIKWHHDRATAASVYSRWPGSEMHWRLEMLGGRWRVETPARLRVRLQCREDPSGRRVCVQLLAMQFAAP